MAERFGTPFYMSPEQLIATRGVDERTDVWSLGVVLHELLTGVLPFSGGNLPLLCAAVLTAPPKKLTEALPTAPRALEAAILKCLEKDVTDRYRNVAELAQDIASFGSQRAVDRVKRIKAVVRRGGASIRPPTPRPGTIPVTPAPVVVTPRAPRATTARRRRLLSRAVFGGLLFVVVG